jgi:hypothetical protein
MAIISLRQVRHRHGSEPIWANPCPLEPSRRAESSAGTLQKPCSVLPGQNPRDKVRNTSYTRGLLGHQMRPMLIFTTR